MFKKVYLMSTFCPGLIMLFLLADLSKHTLGYN